MLSKEEARKRISELVTRFKEEKANSKAGRYNEATTINSFIRPLFEALGWDFENPDEVSVEEKISRGRVDFGFRLNGIPKFFLEAKKISASLNNPDFIIQAINYSWHKSTTWAILTNFQELRVYNAEWKEEDYSRNIFLRLKYDQFDNDAFERLWLLSKESIGQSILDKKAEEVGKKSFKSPIDKQLLNDLTKYRNWLTKSINKYNATRLNLSGEQIDESVQRIIDRLIFVRACEDRGLESRRLEPVVREWVQHKNKKIYVDILEIFKYFDATYNSKLFSEHLCDTLYIESDILADIIKGLYNTSDRTIKYDFSMIGADVLGNIYEQYLGHILKKTAKRANVSNAKAHRKKQGIYYTPTYIVDYIIQNTLGEILKQKNVNVEKIKVLDPACGSGSFLIKAFDTLDNYYKKNDKNYNQSKLDLESETTFTTKTKILRNNIFGVDLDQQAVEIAQLNLLLKIAEKGKRLPLLQQNIKCGNSLIDDENLVGDKKFKWDENFNTILQAGGFDVVIGNPPYIMVENLLDAERKYMMTNFDTALKRFDIYIGFIERALSLMKEGGVLGFIIPYQFLTQDYAEKMREYILNHCTILQIVDLSRQKIFQDATVKNIILIVQKGKSNKKTKIIHSTQPNTYTSSEINQEIFDDIPEKKFRTNITQKNLAILEKISSKSILLGKIAIASWGARGVPKDSFQLDEPINDYCKKMVKGLNVSRYSTKYSGKWFLYDTTKLYRSAFPELFESEKLLFRGIVSDSGMIVSYDNNGFYTDHSLNCLILKHNLKNKSPGFLSKRKIDICPGDIELSKKFNMKFLLGIVNSKLINFYFMLYFSDELHVYPETIEQLPIPDISKNQQQKIIVLVEKMISLNARLTQLGDKSTNESEQILLELEKVNTQLDELIYKLYEITEREIKIVEESLDLMRK